MRRLVVIYAVRLKTCLVMFVLDALLIAFTWVHNWMKSCIVLRSKLYFRQGWCSTRRSIAWNVFAWL